MQSKAIADVSRSSGVKVFLRKGLVRLAGFSGKLSSLV